MLAHPSYYRGVSGPAIFVGVQALEQVWLFWLAPILGALIGGFGYFWLWTPQPAELAEAVPAAEAV